jgi:hypothetical protein
MGVEQVFLGAGAAATALSPKVRGVVRQGLVYAVAGTVTAGNTALGLGRGAMRVVPGVGGSSAKANGHKPRTTSGSSAASPSRSSSAKSRPSQGGSSSR